MQRIPKNAHKMIQANKLVDGFDFFAAVPLMQDFVADNPDNLEAWAELGTTALKIHDAALAEKAFRKVLDHEPNHIGALNALSNIATRRYDFKEAEFYARKAFDQFPEYAASYGNLASFMVRDGRYHEAKELFEKALEISPGDHHLTQGLGLIYLALGDYQTGYRLRARDVWEQNAHRPGRRLPAQLFDLTGRKVFIFPDEGHGDCVAMSRFVPRIKRLGGSVYGGARKPLLRLWQGLEGVDKVIEATQDFRQFETAMSLICLPGYFRISADTVPPPIPFKVPKAASERAQRITAPFKNHFKIGFCWSGSSGYINNYARSTTHKRFLPLANIEGVKLFSLYKGEYLPPYLEDPAARVTVDASSSDADYADAVGTIMEMDLVITVDTCIAHLAGTMGKPTWLLIHNVPYYYFAKAYGDRTPWYPSARIFRQPQHGDWDTPFAALTKALQMHVKAWRSEQ